MTEKCQAFPKRKSLKVDLDSK